MECGQRHRAWQSILPWVAINSAPLEEQIIWRAVLQEMKWEVEKGQIIEGLMCQSEEPELM